MKAVVYKGSHEVSVEDVPEPELREPTDAVVRITSSGICGSDLHMYDCRTAVKPGTVLGYEPMGVIDEIGDAVKLV